MDDIEQTISEIMQRLAKLQVELETRQHDLEVLVKYMRNHYARTGEAECRQALEEAGVKVHVEDD